MGQLHCGVVAMRGSCGVEESQHGEWQQGRVVVGGVVVWEK